jgi:hypothetical protein
MENGCLARMNLIGMRGRHDTVPGIPLKRLNGFTVCQLKHISMEWIMYEKWRISVPLGSPWGG